MKNMKALNAGIYAEVNKLTHYNVVWISMGFIVFFAFYFSFYRIEFIKLFFERMNIVVSSEILHDDIISWFWRARLMLIQTCFTGFGVITAWLFGMEYTHRTVKDMLALPFPRQITVLSKFIALFLFIIALSLSEFVSFCLMGIIIPLPQGWSWIYTISALKQQMLLMLMLIAHIPAIAFISMVSRSYLLTIGIVLFEQIFGNYIEFVGESLNYLPAGIPIIYLRTGTLKDISIYILIIIFIVGIFAAISWWRYIDHNK